MVCELNNNLDSAKHKSLWLKSSVMCHGRTMCCASMADFDYFRCCVYGVIHSILSINCRRLLMSFVTARCVNISGLLLNPLGIELRWVRLILTCTACCIIWHLGYWRPPLWIVDISCSCLHRWAVNQSLLGVESREFCSLSWLDLGSYSLDCL